MLTDEQIGLITKLKTALYDCRDGGVLIATHIIKNQLGEYRVLYSSACSVNDFRLARINPNVDDSQEIAQRLDNIVRGKAAEANMSLAIADVFEIVGVDL